MKLASYKVKSLIEKGLLDSCAILLYGSNYGLVAELYEDISHSIVDDVNDSFLVSDLSKEQIESNSEILYDEFFAVSFSMQRKLIRVKNFPDNVHSVEVLDSICKRVKDCGANNFLLITAKQLALSSKLRSLCEKKYNHVIAVPCYEDDIASITQIIRQMLTENAIIFDDESLSYLAQSLVTDRSLIRQEINKLILYLGEQKKLGIDKVRNIIGGIYEFDYQRLSNSVASRNLEEALMIISNLLNDGVYEMTIVRVLSNYFNNLYYVKSLMEFENESCESAISKLKPALFFKQKPLFISHINSWSVGALRVMILSFQRIESLCKGKGMSCSSLLESILIRKCSKVLYK